MLARSNERVSLAAQASFLITPGVWSRASSPRASRRGEKSPPAERAVSFGFEQFQRPVQGLDLAFDRLHPAVGPAAWTGGLLRLVIGQFDQLGLLDGTAQLLPHLVGGLFDVLVAGHLSGRSFQSIQFGGDLAGLLE